MGGGGEGAGGGSRGARGENRVGRGDLASCLWQGGGGRGTRKCGRVEGGMTNIHFHTSHTPLPPLPMTPLYRYKYLQAPDGSFHNPFNRGLQANCLESFTPASTPMAPVFLPKGTTVAPPAATHGGPACCGGH